MARDLDASSSTSNSSPSHSNDTRSIASTAHIITCLRPSVAVIYTLYSILFSVATVTGSDDPARQKTPDFTSCPTMGSDA
jgi:hypothetical protein